MTRKILILFALVLPMLAQDKDAAGCKDPAILTRIPGCVITSCETKEFGGVEVPIKRDEQKGQIKQNVEGAVEYVVYNCPEKLSGLQIIRNSQNAFRTAGYTELFTDNYSGVRYWLTVRKGAQWGHVYADGHEYNVTSILTKAMEQSMQANADSWASQIERDGRVSIYGINFDTGKATITADSAAVLAQLEALLKKQAGWHLVVAGHTDSTGSDAVNVPLSKQRAEAVIAWLAGKGIDRARLTPVGFGAQKPLAGNDTAEGKAKNRRVDLIRLY